MFNPNENEGSTTSSSCPSFLDELDEAKSNISSKKIRMSHQIIDEFKKRYLKGDMSSEESDEWEKEEMKKQRKKWGYIDSFPEPIPSTSTGVTRRSNRNIPKVSYSEIPERVEDDTYLYCYECNDTFPDGCVEHPIDWVYNIPVECPYVSQKIAAHFSEYFDKSINKVLCNCERVVETHILRTTPDTLKIGKSMIKDAGLGIWTKSAIKRGTTFGPYIGTVGFINEMKDPIFFEKSLNGYSWLVRENIFQLKTHIVDASDGMNANWLRYVNCARNEEEQNLIALQYKGCIFYQAFRDINYGEELLTYYGLDFAKDLGIYSSKVRCQKNRKKKNAKSNYEAIESDDEKISKTSSISTIVLSSDSDEPKVEEEEDVVCCENDLPVPMYNYGKFPI